MNEIQIHSTSLTLNQCTPSDPKYKSLSDMECMPPPASPCTYAIGDLHGNVLKLLAFLLWTHLVNKINLDYCINYIIWAYYKKDYDAFSECIKKLQFNTQSIQNIKLILLGDTLCDRGNSDYMTLLLYELMDSKGVNFTIIVSNHDLAFIRRMELYPTTPKFELNPIYSYDIGFKNLVKAKKIYENAYKPRLKIIEIDVADGRTIIYSHAPCDNAALHKVLGANINDTFNHNKNTLQTLPNGNLNSLLKDYCNNCTPDPGKSALGEFVWNRNTSKMLDEYTNVFGHIGEHDNNGQPHKLCSNQINLDTDLGRHAEKLKDNHLMLHPYDWPYEPDTTKTLDGELKILQVIHNSVAA